MPIAEGRPVKSSEIAKLAGCTVRTLRHYHAIGLLPEPPRGQNGYRDYSAGDLARVLRIKRLASLGFPLARIGDVLDEIDAGLQNADDLRGGTALDELDRELACQIDRLQEQRRTIALLKQQELDPDLPAHLARTAKILLDDERVALPANAGDREALLIVGHLFSEEDAANVEQVMAALDENGDRFGQLAESQAWFDALDPRTPREDIDRIVEEAIPCFDPLIDYFDRRLGRLGWGIRRASRSAHRRGHPPAPQRGSGIRAGSPRRGAQAAGYEKAQHSP